MIGVGVWIVILGYGILYSGIMTLRGTPIGTLQALSPSLHAPFFPPAATGSSAPATTPSGVPLVPSGPGQGTPHGGPAPQADICSHPPALVSAGRIRLTAQAMAKFQAAQKASGGKIVVASSYRSCLQQRVACLGICGNANGCPGLCAPPGQSCHQYGEAVDLVNWQFALPFMTRAGWRHPLPSSDPGHFSISGGRCPSA